MPSPLDSLGTLISWTTLVNLVPTINQPITGKHGERSVHGSIDESEGMLGQSQGALFSGTTCTAHGECLQGCITSAAAVDSEEDRWLALGGVWRRLSAVDFVQFALSPWLMGLFHSGLICANMFSHRQQQSLATSSPPFSSLSTSLLSIWGQSGTLPQGNTKQKLWHRRNAQVLQIKQRSEGGMSPGFTSLGVCLSFDITDAILIILLLASRSR